MVCSKPEFAGGTGRFPENLVSTAGLLGENGTRNFPHTKQYFGYSTAKFCIKLPTSPSLYVSK
jgi:hypothetical protein